MEDETDEWMIEEYSSPSLKETNTTTRLRWLLNKGFGLGKKVAITGFVISSAPVVLPPLVVISAVGFAFSVPFGLVFASCACTEKVMSKLLPSPTASPFIYDAFGKDLSEEEEGDGASFEEEYVMEEEEKEQMEDLRKGVEARIEFDELESGEFGVDDSTNEDEYRQNVYENEVEGKEDNEKEDVGEYYYADEDKLPEEISTSEEGKDKVAVVEVTHVVIIEDEEGKVMGDEEDEEIARGSTGLLEKIRDGGEIDGGVKETTAVEEPIDDKDAFLENLDDKEMVKGTEKEYEDKNVKSDELGGEENGDAKKGPESTLDVEKRNINEAGGDLEIEKTLDDENVTLEKCNGEVKETGDSTSEQKKLNSKVKKRRGKKRGKATSDERKVDDGNEVALDDNKARDVPITENTALKPNEDTRVVNAESVEGSGEEYKYNVEGLNAEEKETAIQGITNAREAALEKGSDVSDDTRGVPYSERSVENDGDKDGKAEEIAEYLELPISKGDETKSTEIAPRQDTPMPSDQESLSEEKLWQKIDSLRVIVGYKAARDKSLIGELKALYIFTGVEPPPSFKDPRDLVEVNEKLRFLMSVVGVK